MSDRLTKTGLNGGTASFFASFSQSVRCRKGERPEGGEVCTCIVWCIVVGLWWCASGDRCAGCDGGDVLVVTDVLGVMVAVY